VVKSLNDTNKPHHRSPAIAAFLPHYIRFVRPSFNDCTCCDFVATSLSKEVSFRNHDRLLLGRFSASPPTPPMMALRRHLHAVSFETNTAAFVTRGWKIGLQPAAS
jgi:hypothetical protein